MNDLLAPALMSLPAVAATGLLIYNDRRHRKSIKLLADQATKSAAVIEEFTALLNSRREARAQQRQSAMTEQPKPQLGAATSPAPTFTHFEVCPAVPGDERTAKHLLALRRGMKRISKNLFFDYVDIEVARKALTYDEFGRCPSKQRHLHFFRSQWQGKPAFVVRQVNDYVIFLRGPRA